MQKKCFHFDLCRNISFSCRNISFSCRNITMWPAFTPIFLCRAIFRGCAEIFIFRRHIHLCFGDLLMQAISRGSRKRILIFNTNENSPNDPIVVVSPETYGGTSDSAVPVVVAYNGGHYVSLHPVGDESIEKTQQLCQQYIDGTYPYKRKDIGKLTSAYTSAEKKQRSRNKERLSLIENLITKTITAGGGGGGGAHFILFVERLQFEV